MELRSLLARLRNKFNLSAAEVAHQDTHQLLGIGIAAVAANRPQADSVAEHVLRFLEENTEAEVVELLREDF